MNLASEQKFEPALYGLLGALAAATFVADLFLPLGIAVWVIYLLPVSLAYFVSRPRTPLVVALAVTVFIILGFFFSPPGGSPLYSRINRTMGVTTAWVIAVTGYFFIQNKLAIRRQEWLQAAQVGIAKVISGEQNLDQLGDNILHFLAEYLGAEAGVIFIQNRDAFRRYAMYAGVEGPVPDHFQAGEGVLGQAAKDQRSFVLNDVPDGYLYIDSGLGRAKPRHLLIAPATADGEVNAVLELGFLQAVTSPHIELLQRLAELIGVAVRSAKYRMQLRELLEETQQQTEELQTQSEELRAANEELQEQSRSLQESQSRLEIQQAELEQTNTQLEEQTLQLEHQRDNLTRAQTALQAQTRELEQSSRYKSEFVANMSHELRTPLNSLLILARLLTENRDGNLSSEQVRFARTIETSGNDLLVLINDVLDISKIEAGHVDLQLDGVGVEKLVEKLKAAFQSTAAQKGLKLRTEIGEDVPVDLETDHQRLEQVLKNFLSNALKFTEQGEVILNVSRIADGRVAFTVRDTGIGIPADQKDAIFEPFRQADGTINRKYGGTGLGLSISRELARLLGGEIQVESVLGQGSDFGLIIPEIYDAALVKEKSRSGTVMENSVAQEMPPPASVVSFRSGRVSASPQGKRRTIEDDREHLTGNSRIILVVEDDMAFSKILYDLARELGFQCLIAETADDGVVIARQYMPDAIILDIGLPDHTGLSVLDRLKRDVRMRHIPIHVVSMSDYTQTALSFGAAGYMLKPVTREKLIQTLEGLEKHLAQRMRRVLIVEDDANQLESLGLLLASRDVETVGMRTAAACLEKLRSETFDCMVLDLSLPDASGFEVLELLSKDDTFSFPPVIVYTGRDLSAQEELRLRKYSKSVIIKGAKSPERLLDEVTLFLHQVVSELPEPQQKLVTKSMNRDAALEGRCILIVEDDIRNIFSLTSVLEPHGVNIKIARNGQEALEVLERVWQDSASMIDLVLMDIMMPVMDGLTATREIRSRPHWKNIPIIALTAKAMADDHEQCLAAGANDYLAKPLDIDKLLSLTRVWMPR